MEEKKNELVSENVKDDSEFELRAVRAEHKYRKLPDEKKPKKKRLGITHSSAAKTMAFILCILMLCVTAVSVFGVVLMFNAEVYWTTEEDFTKQIFEEYANSRKFSIMHWYQADSIERIENYLEDQNVDYVKIKSGNPNYEPFEYEKNPVGDGYMFTSTWAQIDKHPITGGNGLYEIGNNYDPEEYAPESVYTISIGISKDIEICDELYWINLLATIIYAFRFWIYAIGLGSLIIAILCFVFLMCSAGRRRGIPGVRASFLTKIPFEIPTAAVFFASLLGFSLISEWFYYDDVVAWIAFVVWAIVSVIMLIFWFMSLAIRIKLGTLLKNTIVFYILRFIWRSLCFCGRCIRTVVRSLPMIWKTVLLVGIVSAIEFLFIVATYERFFLLVWWFIGTLISTFFIIYFVLMLYRLKKGAKEIADGKLDYKVDTKYLILDLKDHGKDLNRIRDGLNLAVEERLKSERMKTELITNVSHDIKTPLTSIINYSDLICREECENENIKEYASVLHNQSERMKRLLDDLVEASKASSGNIDIMLAECDARVMISQVTGEYYQRLADAGLELVCSTPDDEIKIMADGRRLWRVFDNLMNNARKYALSGTRVYVSLETLGERAVFRFKNISRDQISVKSDELSERFVRGDESRNTEGNGLGLSIAKSLTELQGGVFDITVDGDLFKVTVSFPIIK